MHARSIHYIVFVAVALALAACSLPHHPGPSADGGEADALALHRAWWNALATSDAGYLRAHSSPALVATTSSGRTHTLDSLARDAGTARRTPALECTGESVLHFDAASALAASDCTVASGQYATTYRFLTFMTSTPAGWKVAAAQSTYRAVFASRVKNPASLHDLSGSYRTPRGLVLQVTAHEDFVTLREPSGLELRLEPVGPDLFEADYVAPGGWITRYSFARDATGQIVSLSVLSPGAVNTFPRNP